MGIAFICVCRGFYRVLTMLCDSRKRCVSGLCPPSRIINTRKHNVFSHLTLPTICWMYYSRLQINWVFKKKNVNKDGQTEGQQSDLIGLPLVFQNKEIRTKLNLHTVKPRNFGQHVCTSQPSLPLHKMFFFRLTLKCTYIFTKQCCSILLQCCQFQSRHCAAPSVCTLLISRIFCLIFFLIYFTRHLYPCG
jgi:hypothetical protein